MSQLPLISVVVPVYKVEKYLDQCICSITQQTYRNLEIILVDDGSPDGSGAICDAWTRKDDRIRVIHKENAGAGAARNTALDEVQGELVSMIDSDDYIHPNMYAHLQSLMGPDVGIAECVVQMTELDDLQMDDGTNAQILSCNREEAMRLHILDKVFCQTPPNKLYRKEAIGDIRFPVGNLIDDEFFTYRVIGNCKRLVHSDAVMYAYRQQPGSAMHKPFSLKRLQGLQAKQQRLAYLKEKLPQLEYEAKFDLFFSCLYGMQACLKNLKGEQLKTGCEMIHGIISDCIPLEGNPQASKLKNVLLKMAQIHLEGTAWLLNMLIDLHILT
ncbi:MAG: glycosyltransferase [Oscillospiraceae bacterium]|nr:glycosyltransferase [Oscillospiraceae bacterium]